MYKEGGCTAFSSAQLITFVEHNVRIVMILQHAPRPATPSCEQRKETPLQTTEITGSNAPKHAASLNAWCNAASNSGSKDLLLAKYSPLLSLRRRDQCGEFSPALAKTSRSVFAQWSLTQGSARETRCMSRPVAFDRDRFLPEHW